MIENYSTLVCVEETSDYYIMITKKPLLKLPNGARVKLTLYISLYDMYEDIFTSLESKIFVSLLKIT